MWIACMLTEYRVLRRANKENMYMYMYGVKE